MKWKKSTASFLIILLSSFTIQDLYAEGFFDKIKERASDSYNKSKKKASDSYNKSKKKASDSYNKSKKSASQYYDKSKDRVSDSYNKSKNSASKYYDKSKDRLSDSYNKSMKSASQYYDKSKDRVSDSYNKSKNSASKYYGKSKDRLSDSYNKSKKSASKYYGKSKDRVSDSYNAFNQNREDSWDSITRSTKSYSKEKYNIVKSFTSKAKAKYDYDKKLKDSYSRLSSSAKENIKSTAKNYGDKAAASLLLISNNSKEHGKKIEQRAKSVMQEMNYKIQDPKLKEKAMHGVVAATAVGYYAYTHKDDIQYKVIDTTLENVNINIDGKSVSAEQAITNTILKKAPHLSGTKIAEDPSAVLAYGIVSVGKEDFMEHVEILPSKSGKLKTINETINDTDNAEQVIQALQVGNSVEGIALSASEKGHLGKYGETFATSYRGMEKAVNE